MHALARHAALEAPDSPATAASSPGPQPEVTSHEFDAATATSQLCLASSDTLLPASRSRYRTSRPGRGDPRYAAVSYDRLQSTSL
jgi:hypothetical protein